MEPNVRVDALIELLQSAATCDYIGEDISQLEHALQCAALAMAAHSSETLVLAALLHDIGHFCAPKDAPQMGGFGTQHHEDIGAAFLDEYGFSDELQALVRGHVEAKRYLVGKHPHYAAKMSAASTHTLALQGGPMTAAEIQAFEQDPLCKDKLRLRQWDDTGKQPDLHVPALETYRPMLLRHLSPS